MAKIKVVDQAVVLTSALTNEELAKAQKYFPQALVLTDKDEDGKNVVTYAVGQTSGEGSIGKYGIEFPKGAAAEKASVTILIPKMGKKEKETFVKDEFGKALQNLITIENGYAASKSAYDAEYAEISKNVVVE